MQALIYLDLATKKATETLGQAAFKFPTLAYGEDINLSVRLAQRIQGKVREVSRNIKELRCTIGKVDERPESGKIQIKIGTDEAVEGTNVTTAIAHNAKASVVENALNALSIVGDTVGTASVEEKGGSWLATFAGETEAVTISAFSNSLFPLSFLRVRASEFNGEFIHDLRLIQAPVADTDQSARVVPPPPEISTIIDGGEVDATKWPEVQKLYIPPTFRGVYQIRRGYAKTAMLDRNDGHVEIGEQLNQNLVSSGEVFTTELPTDNTIHITFGGDMVGFDQEELEIEVFDAPEGDLTFTLSLDTPELHTLLRKSDKVTLPIEIEADIEDENNEQIVHTFKLLRDVVTIERSVRWEELSTAASVDWIRPPLPRDYVPFSTTQVSNGQNHYATADFGDGLVNEFTFDHNLNTPRIDVILHENSSSGAPLQYATPARYALGEGDFTWTRDNDNSLELTVRNAPAYNELLITVLALEMTSFFDPHTHPIAQIENLQTILDDLGNRVTRLEDRSGDGRLPTDDDSIGGNRASWQLPSVFEVFPSRAVIEEPTLRLIELDKSQLGRARGLLPAVHDAEVEALPASLPSPSSEYIGRVFENQTGGEVLLTGGKGIRSTKLADGGFAACDGRLWYPVTRYGDHASGVAFTTDFASDPNALNAIDNELSVGTRVNVATDGTLPSPLDAGTEYQIFAREDSVVTLTTVGGDTAIELTDDGAGSHTITKAVETTYYPTAFERELFRFSVNDSQFALRTKFELRFALELAVLKSNTSALWTVAVEIGEKVSATLPATTGSNVNQIVWRGTPILEREINLTNVSALHRFGVQMKRGIVNEQDTIETSRILYGSKEGAVSPKSANFLIRGRLIRFDTEDNQSDPLGFVAVKGLKYDNGEGEISDEGAAVIA